MGGDSEGHAAGEMAGKVAGGVMAPRIGETPAEATAAAVGPGGVLLVAPNAGAGSGAKEDGREEEEERRVGELKREEVEVRAPRYDSAVRESWKESATAFSVWDRLREWGWWHRRMDTFESTQKSPEWGWWHRRMDTQKEQSILLTYVPLLSSPSRPYADEKDHDHAGKPRDHHHAPATSAVGPAATSVGGTGGGLSAAPAVGPPGFSFPASAATSSAYPIPSPPSHLCHHCHL
ncbi:unnamed protein product [Closterium sp. NIES-54]